MRRAVLLAAVLLLAGCSLRGDEAGSIDAAQLENLVLQPADLPAVFLRFDEGRQAIADNPGGTRGDPRRFGRKGGWKARYRRAGTHATTGPLVVASLADVFRSSEGAKDELEAVEEDLGREELGWRKSQPPPIGEEALAMSLEQGSGLSRVSFFLVAWRDDNVVASLEVNGFAGKVDLAAAVALARKQEARIEGAAGR